MSRPTFLGCHFNVFQRVFQPSDVSERNCGPVVVREAAPYHSLAHESLVNFLRYHGQGRAFGQGEKNRSPITTSKPSEADPSLRRLLNLPRYCCLKSGRTSIYKSHDTLPMGLQLTPWKSALISQVLVSWSFSH